METNERRFKKKKKRSFFQKAKKLGAQGRFGRGFHINEDTYHYFIRVLELSRDEFSSDEDRNVFVNNVFDHTTGEEVNYSSNQLASRVIETLLPSANDEIVERYLTEFSKELRLMCVDQFASHVLQTLLFVAAERGRASDNCDSSNSSECNEKDKSALKFRNHVLHLSRFVLNNYEDFATHTYANHVIRTTLECLSGIPPGTVAGRGGKWNQSQKNSATSARSEETQEAKEVPTVYKDLLKESATRFIAWPQLADLAYNNLSSGLIQTLLYAVKAVSKKLTRQLVKKLLDECFVCGGNNEEEEKDKLHPTTELPAVFQCEAATRVMEAAIVVASPKLFTQLYAMCFINRLVALSLSPSTNFTVQKLLTHCKEKVEFEAMFDEVAGSFEKIVASRNTGVVLAIGQTCCRLSTRQGNILKLLMQALHYTESGVNQSCLVHLITRFVTYEEWEADKETSKVNLHGSLLLQTLLKFSKPIKIINCILDMSTNDLKTLICDPKGSHIVDTFMTSEYIGEKSREKFVRKLQGTFVALACLKHGSRGLDAMWSVVAMKQKLLIMDELAPKEAVLRSSQYGSILANKYGLSLYNRRREDWKDAQGKENRKRKLFADIIGDIGKKKKSEHSE